MYNSYTLLISIIYVSSYLYVMSIILLAEETVNQLKTKRKVRVTIYNRFIRSLCILILALYMFLRVIVKNCLSAIFRVNKTNNAAYALFVRWPPLPQMLKTLKGLKLSYQIYHRFKPLQTSVFSVSLLRGRSVLNFIHKIRRARARVAQNVFALCNIMRRSLKTHGMVKWDVALIGRVEEPLMPT